MSAQTVPSVKVQRLIDATPEEVFSAWTEADLVARWFAPGAMRAVVVAYEARPGGQYRVEMHDDAAGKVHTVAGRFVEVQSPRRLVMTWVWVSGESREIKNHETLLTVEFTARRGGTEVTLLHERFSDQASADRHAHGWTAVLENLAQRIGSFKAA